MTSRTMYHLRRELPGIALRLVYMVGILGALALLLWPNDPPKKIAPRKSSYAFDSCVEAMRRDGNGMMKTADACGKFEDSVRQAEQTAASQK